MPIKIIDELQTFNKRLLILDREPNGIEDFVKIGSHVFKRFFVYDMKKAIAIECDEDTENLIGMTCEKVD